MKKLTNLFKTVFILIIIMSMSMQVYGQGAARGGGQRGQRGAFGGFGGGQGGATASWIAMPDEPGTDYGLYYFRKIINLEEQPSEFIINVSADNRYKLYINEVLVSLGPALGDLQHWNYEVVDLAPYLKSGDNIIAAKVWNEGSSKPVSQFSARTGFYLRGTNEQTQALNTNDTWKVIKDTSYTPLRQSVRGYYAAGAGDSIDMHNAVKDWEKLSLDDSSWQQPQTIGGGGGGRGRGGRGGRGGGGGGAWTLVESIIPQMEMTSQRLLSMRRAEGVSVPSSFPAEKASFSIPANTTATILLDQTFYTNAYPTLIFSGGENSNITISYSEGLYDQRGAKGNRNEVEGKTISPSRQDTIISDGSDNQNFTSLNWRTYRYVQLQVETQETPLTIEDFYGTFTGYPFEMNAKINTDIEDIGKIMEIGWRTARSCAVETYMDCPYYERLQYIGDARIQLFVSYFNSGDDRLAKNALNLMGYSRQRDGYTLSRYPDTANQVIPTYSLWYICMLHDYLMYGRDEGFLANRLLDSRQIMNYFLSYTDSDGSLKNVPGWNFIDWATGWGMSTPAGPDGSSALLDLQLLLALQAASEVEKEVGSQSFADFYADVAEKLSQTIKDKYWDSSRKLFADTPDKGSFSQHSNSMAILAGLVDAQQAKEIANLMLSDTSLVQATIYFKYYLHLALTKAGLGDGYLDWLGIWRDYMDLGMTTWGETSELETTRSDCHAWGASPNIEFLRILLGIESDAPYFEKVKIEPHLGAITEISGEMPHPKGKIAVSYMKEGSDWNIEITLPDETTGTFYWQGESHALQEGLNTFKL